MESYYQKCLIEAHKHPHPNKEYQAELIRRLTYWFQVELTKKASQETVEEVRNDNSSCSENTSASPADNSRPSVSVWDVLKKQVTSR